MMMILLFYPRNLPFKFSPNRLNVSFVVVVIVVVVVDPRNLPLKLINEMLLMLLLSKPQLNLT